MSFSALGFPKELVNSPGGAVFWVSAPPRMIPHEARRLARGVEVGSDERNRVLVREGGKVFFLVACPRDATVIPARVPWLLSFLFLLLLLVSGGVFRLWAFRRRLFIPVGILLALLSFSCQARLMIGLLFVLN